MHASLPSNFFLSFFSLILYVSSNPYYAALLTAYILYYFAIHEETGNKDVMYIISTLQHNRESRKNILYSATLNLLQL